jgi:AcrR family transcriptional regulator
VLAAIELPAAQEFRGTSVGEIAKAARTKPTKFYRYFTSQLGIARLMQNKINIVVGTTLNQLDDVKQPTKQAIRNWVDHDPLGLILTQDFTNKLRRRTETQLVFLLGEMPQLLEVALPSCSTCIRLPCFPAAGYADGTPQARDCIFPPVANTCQLTMPAVSAAGHR